LTRSKATTTAAVYASAGTTHPSDLAATTEAIAKACVVCAEGKES
jgi:hypothetical protein